MVIVLLLVINNNLLITWMCIAPTSTTIFTLPHTYTSINSYILIKQLDYYTNTKDAPYSAWVYGEKYSNSQIKTWNGNDYGDGMYLTIGY